MKRVVLLWSLLAFVVFTTAGAWAKPSFKDKSRALQLYNKAAFLAKIGKHEQAVENLREAVSLHPKATYRFKLASSLIELDHFLEAAEELEALEGDEAITWHDKQAVRKSKKVAEELKEKTPTITVAVVTPKEAEAAVRVTLDGDDFDPSVGPYPVDPGTHEIVGSADGFEEMSYEVTLEEGGAETVKIKLKKLPGPVKEVEEEDDGEGMGKWPAIVAWSVGGVALGVGAAFGIVSMDQTGTLYDQYDCKNDRCPEEAEADLNTAKMNGNISTVLFAVAGAGLIVGTILWLVADDDEAIDEEPVADEDERDADVDEEEEEATLKIHPLIGPTFLGVHGTF